MVPNVLFLVALILLLVELLRTKGEAAHSLLETRACDRALVASSQQSF